MPGCGSCPADLTALLDWLDSDLDGGISVEDMAAKCELSASRFHRVFRQETGDTPHNYLRRKRLERAADLLRTTDLGIGEIARQLGFADQFHLSRLFRGEYGMPPTVFRRMTQVAFLRSPDRSTNIHSIGNLGHFLQEYSA
jgi:AraC family transcriptional regulator